MASIKERPTQFLSQPAAGTSAVDGFERDFLTLVGYLQTICRCLAGALVGGDLVRDFLSLIEAAQTSALYCADVDKHIG